MEIKTPCTDDAIIVLDNFRLVASFRGVVAQGFGPLGYWKESDFDDTNYYKENTLTVRNIPLSLLPRSL